MPSLVALKLAELLRAACDEHGMDRFAFLQLDRKRALLIDNFGGCERILNTPMPRAYSIKIRHFLVMFLLILPITLLHRFDCVWLVPIISMIVAYPLLSLDKLGVELENPFATTNLSHLPLDEIAATRLSIMFWGCCRPGRRARIERTLIPVFFPSDPVIRTRLCGVFRRTFRTTRVGFLGIF